MSCPDPFQQFFVSAFKPTRSVVSSPDAGLLE
jgi:hypothetical protein